MILLHLESYEFIIILLGIPTQVIDKAEAMWNRLQKTQKPIMTHFVDEEFQERNDTA